MVSSAFIRYVAYKASKPPTVLPISGIIYGRDHGHDWAYSKGVGQGIREKGQSSMANTGKSYEVLTKLIFEQALQQQSVKNLEVRHNITLQGLKTHHQIDAYWRFEAAGVEYTTVVQCKDWGQTVDQGEMLKFAAVLDDIPGQPRGVFVTRTGYQAGARDVAAAKGIILYTLREPTEQDWDGMIRNIVINVIAFVPYSSAPSIEWDTDWARAECARLGFQQDETSTVQVEGLETDVLLYDEADRPIQTMQDLKISMYPSTNVEMSLQQVQHIFAQPTYLHVSGDSRLPRYKARAISYNLSMAKSERTTTISANDIVAYMLEDVMKSSKISVDRNLRLLLPPQES